MSWLSAQSSLYDRSGTTHHAMGARTSARSSAGAARCQPTGDARAPRDSRASFRHAQNVDGSNPLSDEATAQGCDRDGPARSRLQSHARHEYHRGKASPRGNPRMRATLLCQITHSGSGALLSPVRSICVSGSSRIAPTKRFRTAWVKMRTTQIESNESDLALK